MADLNTLFGVGKEPVDDEMKAPTGDYTDEEYVV